MNNMFLLSFTSMYYYMSLYVLKGFARLTVSTDYQAKVLDSVKHAFHELSFIVDNDRLGVKV